MKLTTSLFLPSLFFFPLPSHANVIVSCFEDSPSPLIPTTYHACFQVIKFIIGHERIELPTLFSRAPNVGYRLPEQWRQGSCVLQLDMNDHAATAPAETETATFKNVADAAASVILACVLARPHLGGSQFVGAKKVMNVTVFGTDAARLKGPGVGGGGLGLGLGRLGGGDFAM